MANSKLITADFFNDDPQEVAKKLLGKNVEHFLDDGELLSVRIIETEAYYGNGDRGSHASLGFTEKRKALFMDPGTIYMYYARGGDSLNFTCQGRCGDAVLVKSGYPSTNDPKMLHKMRQLNLSTSGRPDRPIEKLCNGQTLLCKSLGLKVPEWDCQSLDHHPDQKRLRIVDSDDLPKEIIQTSRLGIPKGRDEDLPYRFIDLSYIKYCTKNPLSMKKNKPIVKKIST